jgi:hydroxypyruvate isomerase
VSRLELCASIDYLFGEDSADPPEQIRRAAASGIRSVEFSAWRNKDVSAISRALVEARVSLIRIGSGASGPLIDADQQSRFVRMLTESVEVAVELGCPMLTVLAGPVVPNIPREVQRSALVTGLKSVVPLVETSGVTLLLEPVNTVVDHPGSYLNSTKEALLILDTVACDHIALLYDLYHSMAMGEEPEEVLAGRVRSIVHFHVADVPGRHEPGSGNVDWPRRLGWLVREGYTGLIGLEYIPTVESALSLEPLKGLLRVAGA